MRNLLYFLLTTLTLATTACQDTTLYHTYRPVPDTGWQNSDTLVYTLPKALPNQDYRYGIGIRHKDSYLYRDIWLAISSDTAHQDTIHLYLADTIGYWKGSGIGETRQFTFPIRPNLPTQDSIRQFRIHHIMQDQPLNGILDIGLKIEEKD